MKNKTEVKPVSGYTPGETLERVKDLLTGDSLSEIGFYEHEKLYRASPKLLEACKAAVSAICKDWTRCDEETGEECKGEKCHVRSHRVLRQIETAIQKAEV